MEFVYERKKKSLYCLIAEADVTSQPQAKGYANAKLCTVNRQKSLFLHDAVLPLDVAILYTLEL